MTEQKNRILLTALIALVALNVCMTGYLIYAKDSVRASAIELNPSQSDVSKEAALNIAKPMVDFFNQRDIDGLYQAFSELARVQVTKEKVRESVEKLYPITGTITEYVYSHAQASGVQDGKSFFVLFYKLRLQGGSMPIGELKITVAKDGEKYDVYGFFVSAKQP
jgi:hypothetical protein